MPAAAVYVAAAVAGVAVAIAFKEFVYEPHIAPTFERWAEEIANGHREAVARRRQRRDLRRGVGVPVRSHASDDESDEAGPARKERPPSIELETLAEKEMQEWRGELVQPGLRRRQPGSFLGESSSTTAIAPPSSPPSSIPAPAPSGAAMLLSLVASGPLSPVRTSPTILAPIPRLSSPGSERSSTIFSVSSRASTPELRAPQPPTLTVMTGALSPPSRTLSPFSDLGARSGTASPAALSASTTEPFVTAGASPRVRSPFADFLAVDAGSGAASPAASATSPFVTAGASPRVRSPFDDFLAVDAAPSAFGSPFVGVGAPADGPRSAGSDDDDDVFSFASPMSPGSAFGEDEIDADVLSDFEGSEISGWASVGSRHH